ncbi:MAG TPA: GspH/FimT family pseudopilin [Burkholderiales bacterium]|nr:GspH/FimT family pseudopilin [Burkholderiales bacterium]
MPMRVNRGFTLPELLIVVTVAGVMLAAGVPSFVEFIRNQRVKTASFDLFSSLTVARSEAITRATSVTITPASTANWANGWTITYVNSGGATVTLREQAAAPNIAISGPTSVVYRGNGRLTGSTTPQFQLTATGGTVTTRCINVDLSGRPVSKAAAC